VIDTDCIGSCKSNYYTIMAPCNYSMNCTGINEGHHDIFEGI